MTNYDQKSLAKNWLEEAKHIDSYTAVFISDIVQNRGVDSLLYTKDRKWKVAGKSDSWEHAWEWKWIHTVHSICSIITNNSGATPRYWTTTMTPIKVWPWNQSTSGPSLTHYTETMSQYPRYTIRYSNRTLYTVHPHHLMQFYFNLPPYRAAAKTQ